MQRQAKTLDHLERARREEEVPYLEEAYRKRLEEDKAYHEEQQRVFMEQHRTAWELDVVEKQRWVLSSCLLELNNSAALSSAWQ